MATVGVKGLGDRTCSKASERFYKRECLELRVVACTINNSNVCLPGRDLCTNFD